MGAPCSSLEVFGYNPAQAAFLGLVARHSGYFLRRQYRAFVPRPADTSLVDFIQRLTVSRHAVPVHLDVETLAYHLTARGLYGALGTPDHPNRRMHERSAILQRLMALDVILRYPMWRLLQGEDEAVAFFTQARGLPVTLLPATRYHHVADVRQVTTRHFIGNGPMFVPSPATVVFSFLDADDWTLGRFRAFLRRHQPLWRALGTGVTVLFVTADATRARGADRVWTRTMGIASTRRSVRELMADCEARQRLEQRELQGLTQADLDALLVAAQRVSRPPDDAAYAAWRRDGERGVQQIVAARDDVACRLETWQVPHRYGMPLRAWGRG